MPISKACDPLFSNDHLRRVPKAFRSTKHLEVFNKQWHLSAQKHYSPPQHCSSGTISAPTQLKQHSTDTEMSNLAGTFRPHGKAQSHLQCRNVSTCELEKKAGLMHDITRLHWDSIGKLSQTLLNQAQHSCLDGTAGHAPAPSATGT